MKKLFLLSSALITAAFVVLLPGCVETPTYVKAPPTVTAPSEVVTVAPPANPPLAPMVASPGPQYVYMPGYWSWQQGQWVWIRGSWVVPPQPKATWVPGKWVHKGHGYIWVSGYWH